MTCRYPRCRAEATGRCTLCGEVTCDKHAAEHALGYVKPLEVPA